MLNFPLCDGLAAQHRQDLLREAERERLAGQAIAGMEGSARHALRDRGRQVFATAGLLVLLFAGGLSACGGPASAMPHADGAKTVTPAPAASTPSNAWPDPPVRGPR